MSISFAGTSENYYLCTNFTTMIPQKTKQDVVCWRTYWWKKRLSDALFLAYRISQIHVIVKNEATMDAHVMYICILLPCGNTGNRQLYHIQRGLCVARSTMMAMREPRYAGRVTANSAPLFLLVWLDEWDNKVTPYRGIRSEDKALWM